MCFMSCTMAVAMVILHTEQCVILGCNDDVLPIVLPRIHTAII